MAKVVGAGVVSRGSTTVQLNSQPGGQANNVRHMVQFVATTSTLGDHIINGEKAHVARAIETENSLKLDAFWTDTPQVLPLQTPVVNTHKYNADFATAGGACGQLILIEGGSQKMLVDHYEFGQGSGTAATMTVRGVNGGVILHCVAAMGTDTLANAQIGASQTSLTAAGTVVQTSLSIMSIVSFINDTAPIDYTVQVTSMSATAKFAQLALVIRPYDGTM